MPTVTPIFIEFPNCQVEPNSKLILQGLIVPQITYLPNNENFHRSASLEEFKKFVNWDALWGSNGDCLEDGEILQLSNAHIRMSVADDDVDWDYKVLPKSA